MFRGLGANTKSFKSYGKSKTNTKNQHKASWGSDSDDSTIILTAPELTPAPVLSDEDDTTDEEDLMVRKKAAGGRKGALEIIRRKRKGVVGGLGGKEEVWSDQENVVPVKSVRQLTGKTKKVVGPIVITPKSIKKVVKPRRKRVVIDSADEEDEFEVITIETSPIQIIPVVKSVVKAPTTAPINARKPFETKVPSTKQNISLQDPMRKIPQDPTTKIPLATKEKVTKPKVVLSPTRKRNPGSATASLSSDDSGIDLVANLSASLSLSSPSKAIVIPQEVASVVLPVSIEAIIVPAPITPPKEQRTVEIPLPSSPNVPIVAPYLSSDLSPLLVSPIHEPTLPIPTQLLPILAIASSPSLHDFTTFVSTPLPPFAPNSTWRKLGEASYSEVFSVVDSNGSEMVVKIIPIALESPVEGGAEVETVREDLPYSSECAAVLREIKISQGVGGMDGFVNFRGVFIVHGDYPTTLLAEWDRFKISHTADSDEQIRPDVLPSNQAFALICLAHGGSDLESYKLRTWQEAASVLYQVAEICARAEESIQFEHRDLHWGNVLVRPTEKDVLSELANLTLTPRKSPPKSSTALESRQSGVQVTLIDFTLSRADLGEQVVFDPFVDECTFDGDGDEQFDVYRSMRDHVAEDWEGFHPLTNLMWLHYLALKLLKSKKLKIPPPPPTAAALASLFASPIASPARARTVRSSAMKISTAVNRRARTLPIRKSAGELQRDRVERLAYEGLVAIEEKLREVVLVEVISAPKKKGRAGRGRKIKVEPVRDGRVRWASAGEFVRWWKEQL